MTSAPMTTTRKFDLTIWGFHKNQQILIMIMFGLLSIVFMVSTMIFGLDIGIKIGELFTVLGVVFYLTFARTPEKLLHFEYTMRFLLSIFRGTDYIYKHEEKIKNSIFRFFVVKNLMTKIKQLTRIKKIDEKGHVEYMYSRDTPHTMGSIVELKSNQPEDKKSYSENVERMLIGMDDKSVLITRLAVRSDLTDFAKPIREELHKDRVPQIVRESMYEHQLMCEQSDEKSYKNHMLVLPPYNANPEKAKRSVDLSVNSMCSVLEELKIGVERLDSEEKVLEMFFEDITHNVHNAERVQ